eukprot:gnl/TRDRNA2_/TRDRNA2_177659_c0_seq2.p1 gnl/TRDRNA2_/TRDRNA2_177659_c0~~gnl/TRDRNA2_/TRDRNA2_177659_c0_seq2.p1  ORF type:complete len:815 (-),score=144.84 gnl/TRDRNA2_/TRDRNA2_177659_c0_seq2:306-2750(-)
MAPHSSFVGRLFKNIFGGGEDDNFAGGHDYGCFQLFDNWSDDSEFTAVGFASSMKVVDGNITELRSALQERRGELALAIANGDAAGAVLADREIAKLKAQLVRIGSVLWDFAITGGGKPAKEAAQTACGQELQGLHMHFTDELRERIDEDAEQLSVQQSFANELSVEKFVGPPDLSFRRPAVAVRRSTGASAEKGHGTKTNIAMAEEQSVPSGCDGISDYAKGTEESSLAPIACRPDRKDGKGPPGPPPAAIRPNGKGKKGPPGPPPSACPPGGKGGCAANAGKGPPFPQPNAGAQGLPPLLLGSKGKGLPGPPPRLGSSKSVQALSKPIVAKASLGRRFHWREFSGEVAGTVFDSPRAGVGLNLEALQIIFSAGQTHKDSAGNSLQEEKEEGPMVKVNGQVAEPGLCRFSPCTSLTLSSKEPEDSCLFAVGLVEILGKDNAMKAAIVLKRLLGTGVPCIEGMERLAAGIEALDLPLKTSVETERLELLDALVQLPTELEVASLLAHPAERLRLIPEGMMRPLAAVPRLASRIRALRLATDADTVQSILSARMGRLVAASRAVRASAALQQLILGVASVGGWINSTDPAEKRGFKISSALGNLRQFRALRGDRTISLLHVVVLSAAGGNAAKAGVLGNKLDEELDASGLTEASREDLLDLGREVASFEGDARWLVAEADAKAEVQSSALMEPGNDKSNNQGASAYAYSEGIRERLRMLANTELVGRARAVAEAWVAAHAELSATLQFFGENCDGSKPAAACGEVQVLKLSQDLLRTLEEFRREVRCAAAAIVQEPERFAQLCTHSSVSKEEDLN